MREIISEREGHFFGVAQHKDLKRYLGGFRETITTFFIPGEPSGVGPPSNGGLPRHHVLESQKERAHLICIRDDPNTNRSWVYASSALSGFHACKPSSRSLCTNGGRLINLLFVQRPVPPLWRQGVVIHFGGEHLGCLPMDRHHNVSVTRAQSDMTSIFAIYQTDLAKEV